MRRDARPAAALEQRPARARRRGRGVRIGLALAGGGPEGAVYEIGALRALEDALEGVDLTDLHSYVGVSAGGFVAACLANGLTPTQLARGMLRPEPGIHPFEPENFFMPAYSEVLRRLTMAPAQVLSAATEALLRAVLLRDERPLGALTALARLLPVGLFDNEPIRRYLQRLFRGGGRTDDFRKLTHHLTIVAADLNSGRPILFGRAGWEDVPISRAVQASTAVPGVYPPVQIEGRYCVDGALLKTVHASAALDDGVELLLCINPIVPVDLAPAIQRGEMHRGALVESGLPAVMSQVFRTLVHSRMSVGMERYATAYPNADVVLFEPGRDEYAMFFANTFSFASRRHVCELAYETTRRDLLARRSTLEPLLARHGVRLRMDMLEDPAREVWAGLSSERRGATAVIDRFDRAVNQLGAMLDSRRRRLSGAPSHEAPTTQQRGRASSPAARARKPRSR